MHLQASYTYLFASYFCCDDVALGDTGHFFQELAKEKLRVPGLSKMQKQDAVAMPSFRTYRSFPKMNGTKTWTPGHHGSHHGPGEEPGLVPPFDLHTLGSACEDPHL